MSGVIDAAGVVHVRWLTMGSARSALTRCENYWLVQGSPNRPTSAPVTCLVCVAVPGRRR